MKSIRNTAASEATPRIIPRNFKGTDFGFVKRKIFLPVGGLWPQDWFHGKRLTLTGGVPSGRHEEM